MTSIKPSFSNEFHFYQPIQVRYADLDTLHHVNNVAIMAYVEHARTGYYKATDIWDGAIRGGFGMVVASVKIDYSVSIQYGDEVRVGIKMASLGSKSLRFAFSVESADGETKFASGEVVMVAYDHETGRSRLIPEAWRRSLAAYENNEELLKNA
ncbi:MAG TPA: thioesterase family protein [Anaerolineaceae bacterium]|nr:thioesterase family protein [Anaerolineaceae bacterium]